MKMGSLNYSTMTEEGSVKFLTGWEEIPSVVRKDMIIDWKADLEAEWDKITNAQIERAKAFEGKNIIKFSEFRK